MTTTPLNIRDVFLQAASSRTIEGVLSKEEKPYFVSLYDQILNTQIVLDAQAVRYSISTEKTSYDSAISTLTTYLGTLTIPVMWNNFSNITKIDREDFTAAFSAVDTAKKVLETKIDARLKEDVNSAYLNGANLTKPLTDTLWYGGSTVQTVTDGKAGTQVRRSGEGAYQILSHPELFTIDRSRSYKTRFWARASSNANGTLYFSLRQFMADGNTPGPDNTGRDPYFPAAVNPHTAWVEYTHIWNNADWQEGITLVQPDFLLNYLGTTGYWEIQDLTTTDVTEIVAAQEAADLALSKLSDIASDNILSKNEKPQANLVWTTIYYEQAGISSEAASIGVSHSVFDTAYTALANYLTALSPGFGDYTNDTVIVGGTYLAKFSDYYIAKQALLNAIAAKIQSNAAAAQATATSAQATADAAQVAASAAQSAADSGAASAAEALVKLTNIGSDLILSPGEKPEVLQKWNVIIGELQAVYDQGTAYGCISQRDAYNTVYGQLYAYLDSIPGWNVIPGSDVVITSEFRGRFENYYIAKQALLNAIATEAGKRAVWANGITGRPADHELLNSLLAKGDFINQDPNFQHADLWSVQSNGTGSVDLRFAYITGAQGASSKFCVFPQNLIDQQDVAAWLLESRMYPIDPSRVYEMSGKLYSDTGNDRTAYLGVCFYTSDGTFIANTNWGGSWSGYPVVVTPTTGQFTRYAGLFGPGTNKLIPSNATQCRVGVILNYGVGSAGAIGKSMAAQDLKLVDATAVRAAHDAAIAAQTTATAAETQALAANVALGNIASDNVLSMGEKSEVILKITTMDGEYSDIIAKAVAVSISVDGFNTARNALNAYLTTLSPVWSDTTTNTAIVGTTFRAMFEGYYTARQVLLNAIAAKAATTANWTNGLVDRPTDAQLLNNRDNRITNPGGGIRMQQDALEYGAIKISLPVGWSNTMLKFTVDIYEYRPGYSCQVEVSGYTYQATTSWINVSARMSSSSGVVEYPVYFGYDGTTGKCAVWIGTTTDEWAYPQICVKDVFLGYNAVTKEMWENGWDISISATAPTNVSQQVLDTLPGSDWTKVKGAAAVNAAIVAAQATATNAANAAAAAQADADAAEVVLNGVVSDNILSRSEKSAAISEWNKTEGEVPQIEAQAASLGVSSASLSTAHNALANYLVSLSPYWSDISADTPITGPTYRSYWTDYNNAKISVLNAISAKASEKALWANIAGQTNAPENNATVGANKDNLNVSLPGDNMCPNSSFERHDGVMAEGFAIYNNGGGAEPTTSSIVTGNRGGSAIRISWTGSHYQTKGIYGLVCTGGWVPGKTYTVSFDAHTTSLASTGVPTINWNTPPSTTAITAPNITSTPQRYVFRIVWGETVEASGQVYISAPYGDGAGNIIFDDLMVTEGDVPAKWYPSTLDAQAIADAAKASAVTANSQAAIANAILANISNDNVLTAPEKPALVQAWNVISGELQSVYDQGTNYGLTTLRNAYDAAYYDLANYLTTIAPQWYTIPGTDVAIDGSVLRARFSGYYLAKQNLLNGIVDSAKSRAAAAQSAADTAVANAATAQATANAATSSAATANAALAVISSDAWLSKGEKPAVIKEWETIYFENSNIVASASAAGLSSTAFSAARTALDTYLGALTPPWSDVTTDTPIDAATFRSKFYDFYLAQTTLLNAIAADARTKATGVTLSSNGYLSGGGTSGRVTTIGVIDDVTERETNRAPNWYQVGTIKEFKQSSTLGLATGMIDGDYWCTLETTKQYTDNGTGFPGYQYALQVNKTWRRHATSDAGTAWTAWTLDLDRNSYTGDLDATKGSNIVRSLDDSTIWATSYGTVSLVAVSDAPAGKTVRRSQTGLEQGYLYQTFLPLDRQRKYRTRFWARAASGTNGYLYHALQQIMPDGNGGPSNSGLNPYKPSGVSPHTNWVEYNYDWTAADWQVGVTQLRPYFILNYTGNTGYWEIQDYVWSDITEAYDANVVAVAAAAAATAAQAGANAANAAVANISSDSVLSRGEKSQLIQRWEEAYAEAGLIPSQASDLGVSTTTYNAAYSALSAYLISLSPTWSDTSTDTPIVGSTFRSTWYAYTEAKVALLNAISAAAATKALWANIAGQTNAPANNATVGADASNLQVGLGGRNQLINSLPNSAADFSHGGSSLSLETGGLIFGGYLGDGSNYTTDQRGVIYAHWLGNPVNGDYYDIYSNQYNKMFVSPGSRYEFGVDLSVHRCTSKLIVAWYNGSGVYLSENEGTVMPTNGAVTTSVPFPRSILMVTAPASSVYAMVFVRTIFDGQGDPYVFTSKWYGGIALAAQTVPSPWTESPSVASNFLALARANADVAVAALAIISSDAWLSKSEKPAVHKEWELTYTERSGLVSQAATLSVSATTYIAAYTALDAYLNSLSPTWSDVTTDTPVVAATFRAKFIDYFSARTALQSAISNEAATKALWANIVGQTNAPASNATVGAKAGENLLDNSGSVLVDAAIKNFYNEGGMGHLIRPSGGSLTLGPSVTGAIAIILPTGRYASSTMVRIRVEVYEYATGAACTYIFSGYNYSSQLWYNVSASYDGPPASRKQVRFGRVGSPNREIIYIGETNTVWQYPQVKIVEVITSYAGYDAALWASGWACSLDTSFGTIEHTVASPGVGGALARVDQITSGNVSTLIGNAAITDDQIANNTFTVSITGTLDTSKSNTTAEVGIGTLTASVTGPSSYTILWTAVTIGTDPDGYTGLVAAATPTASTSYITAKVSNSNMSVQGLITLLVIDDRGRSRTATRTASVQFGTPL